VLGHARRSAAHWSCDRHVAAGNDRGRWPRRTRRRGWSRWWRRWRGWSGRRARRRRRAVPGIARHVQGPAHAHILEGIADGARAVVHTAPRSDGNARGIRAEAALHVPAERCLVPKDAAREAGAGRHGSEKARGGPARRGFVDGTDDTGCEEEARGADEGDD